MSDRSLRLEVVLKALDQASRPIREIAGANRTLAKDLRDSRARIKELSDTQRRIGEFREMRAGLDNTSTKLSAAKARVKELAKSLRDSGPPSQQMISELEKARQAASKLGASFKKQSASVDELRGRLARAGVDTRNLSEHERTLRSSIDSTIGAMTRQQSKLADLTARTKRLADAREKMNKTKELAGAMAGTGVKMTAGGAAIGAATLVPVSEYAKAEDSATQLASALMRAGGVVPPEFERINALALKLGDRLPGTTADFQDMMTMLTRQGISAQSILGGMGEATAYLGVQLKKSPAEAAEFTAKLQDATRTTEQDMLSLTDVIQKAFMLGVDDNNMLNGFAKLGPAMDTIKQKGIEGAKALAPLLVMADQSGMEGSAAGNAYRKVFQLGMDGKKVAKANKQLAPAQRLDFTNGKGEFGGLDKMFAQFEKLKTLNTQKRLGVLKEVFGDDAETLQVISLMIEKGKAGYDEVQAKMAAQASMQERVNKQLGTLKNLWEAAGGTFTNGLVALGEAIAPEVKAVVEWLGELAGRLGEWVRENPRLANGLMKVAAATAIILAALGGLTLALAAVLGPLAIVRFSMTTLGIRGGGLARAIGDGSRALLGMTGSASGAASGVNAAGKGVQAAAGRIRSALSGAWQASSPRAAASSLRTYVASLSQRVPAACRAAKASVLQWGVSAATAMKNGASAARQYTVQVWRAVAAQAAASRTAVASRWTAGRQYVARRGASGMAVDTARGGLNLVKGGTMGAINGVRAALGGLAQTLMFVGRVALMSPIGLVIAAIAIAALLIVKYWEPIKAFFSGFWQGLTEGLKPLAPIFTRVFGVLGAAFEPLKPVFDWLIDAVKGAWNWIKKLLGPVDSSKESLDKATNAGKGFGAWLADIIVVAAEAAGRFVEFGANMMTGLVNGIKSGLSSVKEAIESAGGSVIGWFKEKLGIHSPSRVFAALGGFTMAGLDQGLREGQDGPLSTVLEVGKRIVAAGAGIGITGAAIAGGAPLTVDSRPPLTVTSAAARAPVAPAPITIQVYAAPGMDEQALAQKVLQVMRQEQAAQAARERSRLRDRD
ncbi:phage tail tape measure protein [Burkholderia cepacia]|uniref:phage tail tape measure protein n=1 Tax=Burkholderia cepacia TaxID=292 RepID=UPI0007C84540|nr:phage tail tape measure protein [Burkholderia cepacia]